MTFTIEQQIAELKRELHMRAGVYPRFVNNKRMTSAEAETHIGAMAAAVATLENVRDERRARVNPSFSFGDMD